MGAALLISCLCFALACGAARAHAGELLLLASQKFCTPLSGPELLGCNAYWTNSIGMGVTRPAALTACYKACEDALGQGTSLATACKNSCQTMNGNDN